MRLSLQNVLVVTAMVSLWGCGDTDRYEDPTLDEDVSNNFEETRGDFSNVALPDPGKADDLGDQCIDEVPEVQRGEINSMKDIFGIEGLGATDESLNLLGRIPGFENGPVYMRYTDAGVVEFFIQCAISIDQGGFKDLICEALAMDTAGELPVNLTWMKIDFVWPDGEDFWSAGPRLSYFHAQDLDEEEVVRVSLDAGRGLCEIYDSDWEGDFWEISDCSCDAIEWFNNAGLTLMR